MKKHSPDPRTDMVECTYETELIMIAFVQKPILIETVPVLPSYYTGQLPGINCPASTARFNCPLGATFAPVLS
jgi:hypothetical protein